MPDDADSANYEASKGASLAGGVAEGCQRDLAVAANARLGLNSHKKHKGHKVPSERRWSPGGKHKAP